MEISLQALADRIGARLRGDGARTVVRVGTLENADENSLSFLADRRYRSKLARTRAGAVVVSDADAELCAMPALIAANPYLVFSRALSILHPAPDVAIGVHASAVVEAGAQVHPSASVGALCVIERDVRIAADVIVGPGCIIQRGSIIGAGTRLVAHVTICAESVIGERVLLHPGAVIGREGFGFAKDGEHWVRIPQIGRVRIGNDVEVGANSAIDRGAIEDTVIADGVKIDNLIQIGHNVRIGENTAMAACSGISGSTTIGRNCTIGGAVGMAGHLQIGDDVHFTGMAMVTKSFPEPGVYSSGIPAMSNAEWRKNAARFRQLDDLARRLKRLEDRVPGQDSAADDSDG